jgi:hypothetical protein
MKQYTEIKIDETEDSFGNLPAYVKEDIEIALQESERGEGKTHDEFMKKYDKWRMKCNI